MFKWLKYKFYFLFAAYFKFFAKIQLALWQPRIVVVTGSNGKTTLLHIIESQLKNLARYSHHANSSFGIPFDILGLKRAKLTVGEWPYLFLAAPFKAFKKPYAKQLYIVEADCDRPGEGKFLASLLKPDVAIWMSLARTHSVNFDSVVKSGRFANVEEAIVNEFGYFLEYAGRQVIVNADDSLIGRQLARTRASLASISKNQLTKYQLRQNQTEFSIDGKMYKFNCLVPEEVFYSLAATIKLLEFLKLPVDLSFANFYLPPGRSSVFAGIKNTTIIDSSYNANLDSMKAMLEMFKKYPAPVKWVALGDMLEQGRQEQEEHEKLAGLILSAKFDKIILMGQRVSKYTYPILAGKSSVIKFEKPREALNYILDNIRGGETILFKGARFMEGIVEHLLLDKNDVSQLCRREKVWQERRKEWGL